MQGIALVGDPEFALVDEAFPYISKRLLTDETPRLRDALKYMVYGKSKVRYCPVRLRKGRNDVRYDARPMSFDLLLSL